MKVKYGIGILLLGLLAGSCKLGGEYVRPELNLPEKIEGIQDSVNISEIKWWELYQDTVLQQLIRRTLENNKDMQIAVARVKEMMEMKRIGRAGLFPQIDAKIAGQREYDRTPDNTFEAKGL